MGASRVVIPGSCYSGWVTANDDLTATVPSTPLNPAASTGTTSSCHWIEIGPGVTRCLIRARTRKANTWTTQPVVRLIGAFRSPTCVVDTKNVLSGAFINADGSMPNDGTVEFMRIDLAASTGTGITLTFVDSGANEMFDAATTAQAYSDPTTLTPYDLLGARYLLVMPITAGVYNSGTGTTPCEVLLMN